MKTFAYRALGCKVNQFEGDEARSFLEFKGLVEVPDRADLVVMNTCAVTHRAVQKGRQTMRRLLAENPQAAAVLTGCMTPDDVPAFEAMAPVVHIAVNRNRDTLRNTLSEIVGPTAPGEPAKDQPRKRAYLKVQDGCNLRCSYCIIPTLRGRSRSRPLDECLAEFDQLQERGHLEIVLCGIHPVIGAMSSAWKSPISVALSSSAADPGPGFVFPRSRPTSFRRP